MKDRIAAGRKQPCRASPRSFLNLLAAPSLGAMAVDLDVLQELEDLARRGGELDQGPPEGSMAEICALAARLRTRAPAALPLDAAGMPRAPLPRGFWLPWPGLEEMVRGPPRAPPPALTVSEAWAVELRPLPPATAVLYTVDGSVPRAGAPGTLQATQAPLRLEPGGQVYAAACGRGLQMSDLVTLKRPGARPEVPKKLPKRSSFRNDLLPPGAHILDP